MGERRTPRNVEGQPPTRTRSEREERLRDKMARQRGAANRRRTERKLKESEQP